MDCKITFRNLEHTEALDSKIKDKSKKLGKFLRPQAKVSWTCWIENKSQIAEVMVNDKDRQYVAKASSDDLYKTMDLVVNKISNQISHNR